jgi:hypothetical protein
MLSPNPCFVKREIAFDEPFCSREPESVMEWKGEG